MSVLADFRDVLRLLLGDLDAEGVYAYQDFALDSAVRTVFRLGRSGSYILSGDTISPDVADGDGFARIAYEAALMLVGGEETLNYRTRALSVTRSPDRKRHLVTEFRLKIYEGDAGDSFASAQAVSEWLLRRRLPQLFLTRVITAPSEEAILPAVTAADKYSELIGDGSSVAFDITHGLGTREVFVAFIDQTTGEYLVAAVKTVDENTIHVGDFAEAPAVDGVRVMVRK